ncbi:hypothetical protein [Desulfocapsa sulfexigens]|uniref:hypothetical protein n=1 Tax=Desulfocapsa sulfexigens TaxID=65555 RepID=UPI001427ECEE|nr:hypothetical protein [Desulfocapsa sulfexigens]
MGQLVVDCRVAWEKEIVTVSLFGKYILFCVAETVPVAGRFLMEQNETTRCGVCFGMFRCGRVVFGDEK